MIFSRERSAMTSAEELTARLYDLVNEASLNKDHPTIGVLGRATRELIPVTDQIERAERKRGTPEAVARSGLAQAYLAQALATLFAGVHLPRDLDRMEQAAQMICETMIRSMVDATKREFGHGAEGR
jgi:hypothetical protein